MTIKYTGAAVEDEYRQIKFNFDSSTEKSATDQDYIINLVGPDPEYAFNEGDLLKEIKTYIRRNIRCSLLTRQVSSYTDH